MVELLDNIDQSKTNRQKQIDKRYRVLMFLFLFINLLFLVGYITFSITHQGLSL